jgi:tetratricopeptide (TPR) repeat protein
MPNAMDRTTQAGRAVLLVALLSMFTLAAFWPVFHNDFIRFDDNAYVLDNPRVLTGLTWANVHWAFRTGYQANWHPLTWLSHMLDVQLFGLRPGWHHFTNLLLHLANTLLLFGLLRRLTGAEWRSFFVAALFAVHPLHVESVAWVAERKDVLSTFFFMLALLAYARYVRCDGERDVWRVTADGEERAEERGQRSEVRGQKSEVQGAASSIQYPASSIHHPSSRAALWYFLSLLCFALGLMSKPMLVTMPFVLLLLDLWPLDRLQLHSERFELRVLRPLLLEKVPFFGLALLSSSITYRVQTGGLAIYLHLPLATRAANAVASYAKYLGKTIWPSGLTVFYPHPDTHYPASQQWPASGLAAAAVFLVAISVFALLRLKRAPWFAVGWFWYLGTLVPVIGLVQVGAQAMADRYTYVPLIGVFILVVWGAATLAEKFSGARAFSKPGTGTDSVLLAGQRSGFQLCVGAGLLLTAICAGLANHQARYWKDNLTLFERALAVTADNAMAEYYVGRGLQEQGKFGPAMEHYQAAVRADPGFLYGYLGQGNILEQSGKTEEALKMYQSALRAAYSAPAVHNHIATVLWSLGRQEEALRHYAEALRWNPDFLDARYNLGMALASLGNFADAEKQFLMVLQLRPGDREAFTHLAEARYRLGRLAEAEAMYAELVRRRPTDLDAVAGLGRVLLAEGKLTEFEWRFREAVERFPTNADLRLSLANALMKSGQTNEANDCFAAALKLQPGLVQDLLASAKEFITQSNLPAALARATTATRLKPDDPEAQQVLALVLEKQANTNRTEKR